jgi:hypothetical protein
MIVSGQDKRCMSFSQRRRVDFHAARPVEEWYDAGIVHRWV